MNGLVGTGWGGFFIAIPPRVNVSAPESYGIFEKGQEPAPNLTLFSPNSPSCLASASLLEFVSPHHGEVPKRLKGGDC